MKSCLLTISKSVRGNKDGKHPDLPQLKEVCRTFHLHSRSLLEGWGEMLGAGRGERGGQGCWGGGGWSRGIENTVHPSNNDLE